MCLLVLVHHVVRDASQLARGVGGESPRSDSDGDLGARAAEVSSDEARTAKFVRHTLTFTTGRDASEVLADFEHKGYCIDEMESVHITPLAAE